MAVLCFKSVEEFLEHLRRYGKQTVIGCTYARKIDEVRTKIDETPSSYSIFEPSTIFCTHPDSKDIRCRIIAYKDKDGLEAKCEKFSFYLDIKPDRK
jgi:hypothetical protein